MKRKNAKSETPTKAKKTSRKFRPHWKDDFPWIMYDEEKSVIVCDRLQNFQTRKLEKSTAKASHTSSLEEDTEDTGRVENETIHYRLVENGQPVNHLVGHKAIEHTHAGGQCYYLS